MVKFFFILFIFTSISIHSEFQAEYWTYGKRRLQTETKQGKEVFSDTRRTEQAFLVSANFNNKKENFKYDFKFHFAKKLNNSESKDFLFVGENANIGFEIKKTDFILGRKIFSESNFFNQTRKDGIEGVSAEFKPSENYKLNFYFLDFYRAFPILDRVYFIEPKESIKTEILRHGTSFEYFSQNITSKISFLYLNLGDTGRLSRDESFSKPKGDNDFMYNVSWNVFWKNQFFITGMNLSICRGLDKTNTNPERKEKSIQISGELFEYFFQSNINIFQIKSSIFLPDSDKKNQAGEILEYGFIGMGAYPSDSFLINQDLNFYPSGWITQNGLEKNFIFQNGRWNSFWGRISLALLFENFQIIAKLDHYTPRLNSGSSTGSISYNRRDFSKSFLAEPSLEIVYGKRETGFYLKANLSALYTSKDISIESNSFNISGGIWL